VGFGDLGANVHVWRVCLSSIPSSAFASFLSEEERARAGRFRITADRDRFAASHGWLRTVISWYVGIAPSRIAIRTEHGKPRLADSSLTFSLAHSGDFALIAVAEGREIGVDVECEREIGEADEIARLICGHAERRAVERDANRHVALLRCWVRKEAFAKAVGLGLGEYLRNVPLCTRTAILSKSLQVGEWFVHDISLGPSLYGAVATEGRVARIWLFRSELVAS